MSEIHSTSPVSPWRNLGKASQGERAQLIDPRQLQALTIFFIWEVISLTFFQKIAVPLNLRGIGLPVDGGQVEAALPMSYLGMASLWLYARPKVDLYRFGLFLTFLVTSLISILLQKNTFSSNSIVLAIAIYLPFIFYVETTEYTYRRLIGIFLNFMLIFGIITLLQHATQLMWSWKVWPNLNTLIPQGSLFQGYVYIQPIIYGSHYMKPNGVFFLEVSYLAQFLAVAFALELIYFQRIWRLMFYAGTIVSTFSGTGLLLILVSAPILLGKLTWRTLGAVLLVVAACVVLAVQINWYQQVEHRFGEYKNQTTSANHRFVEPLEILIDTVKQPKYVFSGAGPGNGAKDDNTFWWVSTKIVYEYGLVSFIAFIAFFLTCMFKNTPSRRMAFVLVVMFNFMSGFIIPVYPLLIFLIGGLFRVRTQPAP
jgi:hypothetical protein